MNKLFIFILGAIITYFEFQALDYYQLKKYCKKNKGVCKNCVCFSCPRKLYIDEYKINSKSNNLHN